MAKGTCSVDGCDKTARSRGWCPAHYRRWSLYGAPLALAPLRLAGRCAVEGCEKHVDSRGWCRSHYERWRRHGDPLGGRTERGVWSGAICSIEACSRPVKSRGWCNPHYDRWRAHGDPLGGKGVVDRPSVCKIEGCDSLVEGRGWCKRHYQKWYRTGDPEAPDVRTRRGAPLRERLEASAVRTEYCWIWSKRLNHDGYGTINVAGRGKMAHRASYEEYVGPIPDGLVLDHLCRNRACIRPDHLQPVLHAENVRRGASTFRKSHCLKGHEFKPANTRWVRQCVACHDDSRERWQANRKT